MPLVASDALKSALPCESNVQQVVFADSAHAPFVSHFEECVAIIQDFVRAQP
jgi:pimeloyl-ACP methyl ester carboxylesterase